jgi:hypothetical protein
VEAILLGIDGTGTLSNSAYRSDMRHSFVSYIVRSSPARARKYLRGPALDGFDMAMIVANGYEFVHLNVLVQPKSPILLAGYSRGGAGVVAVAARLAQDDVKVSAMVLFDAVDRAIGIDSTEIPTNVEHVVYARRDPYAFTRQSFGNCATRWHAPTRCEMKYFRGTHGALGGVPAHALPGGQSSAFVSEGFPEATPTLITYAQDSYAAKSVWEWVKPRLRGYGYFGVAAEGSANV